MISSFSTTMATSISREKGWKRKKCSRVICSYPTDKYTSIPSVNRAGPVVGTVDLALISNLLVHFAFLEEKQVILMGFIVLI